MTIKDTYCSYCGSQFADAAWPRRCATCGEHTYRNPVPVAVAVQPMGDGLLVVRRAIEPCRGEAALPGGFIDHGEPWQGAVVRELREETGLVADAADVTLYDAYSSPGGPLLLFGLLPPLPAAALPVEPTEEVLGYAIMTAPAPLAFPSHTDIARRWLDSLAATG